MKPDWSEEEQQVRGEVINDVTDAGGFGEAGLKKQIMVDRSAPVVNGNNLIFSPLLLSYILKTFMYEYDVLHTN